MIHMHENGFVILQSRLQSRSSKKKLEYLTNHRYSDDFDTKLSGAFWNNAGNFHKAHISLFFQN